jgi:1-acyl-sn-glycerol-3-phosphate acyltransferase
MTAFPVPSPMTSRDLLLFPAVLLVVLLGLNLALAFARRGPEDTLFIAILRQLNRLLVRLHRLRLSGGADPLPPRGPCIVVANHRSLADPALVAATTRRWIRFLMAREFFEARGLRWLFRRLECIPVNRDGNDLGATRAALKALKAGQAIGIFPQGGIRDAEDPLGIGKAGVALLALRTGAPVVPLYIEGSPVSESLLVALLRPSRVRISSGEPLHFGAPQEPKPWREDLERVTAAILQAIGALKARAEEGLDPAREVPSGIPPA